MGSGPSNKFDNTLKCKVPACQENHSMHYCKFCKSQDSNHFSHQCTGNIPKNLDPSNISPKQNNINFPKFRINSFLELPYQNPIKWRQIEDILNQMLDLSAKIIPNKTEMMELLINHLYCICSNTAFKRREIINLRLLILRNKECFNPFDFYLVLSFMIDIALRMPIFFNRIKLDFFYQQKNGLLSFSKIQIACLLSHMFFGTIVNFNNSKISEKINFHQLLYVEDHVNVEKLLCIFNYFDIMRQRSSNPLFNNATKMQENVIYERKSVPNLRTSTAWRSSNKLLEPVFIDEVRGIEELNASDSIQVDFANKFIGGGVLRDGSIQEEIRFSISPECIPAMIFFEFLEDNEVCYIEGTEIFSQYEGYSKTFRYRGPNKKITKTNVLLLMDAIKFNNTYDQFTNENFLRELNKAFIGFDREQSIRQVITGKWGCGFFKGDPQLKFIIQWLACSECGKNMYFCSFKDTSFELAKYVLNKLNGCTVGYLFSIVLKYINTMYHERNSISIFELITRMR